MVRVRRLKILFLIMSVLLVAAFIAVPSSALGNVVDIGISLTDQNLDYAEFDRGDIFTVNIDTPVFPENADGVEIKVYYDANALELVDSEWTPGFGNFTDLTKFKAQAIGASKDAGGSFFAFAASSAKNDDIPVKDGFTLSARLRVKPTAKVRSTVLTLSNYSVAYNEADGVTPHEMWASTVPSTNTTATIAITGTPHDTAVTGGGISADKTILDRGDTVNVSIAIPTIAWDADDPSLTVSYDPAIFDLVTWAPAKGTKITNPAYGTFGVNFSNVTGDLDTPTNLTAVLKVKDNAANGNCRFTLIPNINEGSNPLWIPDHEYADVTVTGLPVIGGGMTVSPTSVKRGEKVTATITVPPISELADHGEIQINFNKDAFKVTKWAPSISGAYFDNDTGVIIIDADEVIDLSSGLKLTAELTAKDDAELGQFYPFTLAKATFTRTEVGRKQTIWLPADTMKYAEVEIAGSFPVTGKGGIAASPVSLDLGDEFKVTVTVPPINAKVDAVNLDVSYRSDMFELTNLTPSVSGLTINSSANSFGISGTDLYPKLDLSSGLTLTADLKVKYTAKKGTYDFNLTKSTLTYKKTDGTIVSVWTPLTTKAQVTIKRDETDFPVRSDGISVTPSRVKPDGTFTATVKVPAVRATGETFAANVTFDPNVFEVRSVTSSINNISTAYGEGYFSANLDYSTFDLSKGLTITASMKVRNYVTTGRTYDLTLLNTELTGYVAAGAPSQKIWEPASTVAKVTVPSPEDDYPVSGGGISLSHSNLYAGDQFTLYYKVPAMDISADALSFTIDFDGNAFEVITWDPHLTNGIPTYSTGSIGLNAGGGSGINLRSGLTLSATLKAKTNANPAQYSFRLSRSSITSTSISKELWTPVSTTVPLTVLSKNGNNSTGFDPSKRDQWEPWNQWDPWHQWNQWGYWDPYKYYDPYNHTPSNNNGNSNKDDFVYDPDDDDRDEIPVNDKTDEINNSSTGNANIELDGNLRNVANQGIKVKTKKKFFYGDTIILIRNTDIADMSAAAALGRLSMTNCQNYAFDVSVYDLATGTYIHTIEGGYIDISIPVPTVFTGSPEKIAVYHTQDGNPEYIESEIVYENGIKKVKFRANSFSPYMFVDPTSTKTGNNSGSGSNYTIIPNSNTGSDDYYVPNNNTGNGGNSGGNNGNDGTVRPANPSTGSTIALIVIPAATLGCVLLAKKSKRKRSSRR